jgi:hypothetical protein
MQADAKTYEPRGKMIDLMAALRAQPEKLFTLPEVAGILACKMFPSTVGQYISAAVASARMYHACVRGEWVYSLGEITNAALIASGRAPRTGGLDAKVMAAPKYSVEERGQAAVDPRAPGPSGFVPKPMTPTRPSSEFPRVAAASPAATQAPTPASTEAPVEETIPEAVESAEEGTEFNATLWLDGDLVIYGATELEDGGVLIKKDQLAQIKRMVTWSSP